MENNNNLPAVPSNALSEGYSHIKGWGIDADLKNDPTYPIKRRTDEERFGYTWERPAQQARDVEILTSTERNNLPAVFGTTLPPSGLSGAIRRFAFKYSESDYAHWLPLMLADRVGVAEGIISDLSRGHIPDYFNERGWGAEMEYNRKNFLLKVAAGAAVATAITALLIYRKRQKNQ
ncbi:hypothetical protein HYN59_16265 [Flavobacterium album]|uniref:Uncharacterized protein n=1 Tax=Flavobacterium album TaxID=2175091 RepID=A0A2S1R1Q0_9FLAO|nr:hypothetical protein [Flavobacterium album]AWH86565.1 hypothetical protein HYN59_16265 [Flavobacterium album]